MLKLKFTNVYAVYNVQFLMSWLVLYLKAFQQFDTDGSGVVEVSTILSALKCMNGPNMMGELGKSIRMLQACSLTPGNVFYVYLHLSQIYMTRLKGSRAQSDCNSC